MSNALTRFLLNSYRRFGKAVYPFMGPLLALRARRGKEDRTRRYERYGYPSAERPEGPMIWFHAASVGESMAVLALIERVQSMGINTVMTTGTVTSAEIVKKRLPKTSFHQYVPLDLQPAVIRFLEHWKPDLAVFTESEIWPTTIEQLKVRKIPQILVNARMSDKSYKRWSGANQIAETLFDNFSYVIAQSELDADRYRTLGARPVTVSGNLKGDTKALAFNASELKAQRNAIGGRPVWVAASTHKGEEEIILLVHQKLKADFPNLLTILVPRHPERGDEIEELINDAALISTRRSRREAITTRTDIYLADTIGEMGLFLRMAPIVFMGRSLTVTGGQNPLEPAATGTAILAGKHVNNFRDSYRSLLKNKAVRLVEDGNMLAANLAYLLNYPDERDKMVVGAEKTLKELGGALERTIEIMDAYTFPLTVKRKLEEIKNGGK